MTLIFAPCFLAKNRVPDFLKVQDPKKISGRPDKLDIKVQIDWAIVPILCTKFFFRKGKLFKVGYYSKSILHGILIKEIRHML